MKKLIMILAMLILIPSSFAQNCQPNSFPIWGKVDFYGEQVAGQKIIITAIDGRNNEYLVFDVFTNEKGEYSEDLYNYEQCWPRLVYKLKIKGCEGSAFCTKEFDISKSLSVRADFVFREIVDSERVVIEGDKTIIYREKPIYVCNDGSKVIDSFLCPKERVILKCQDGQVVSDLSECLETESQVKIYIATGLGSAAIGGLVIWRLIVYYSKKGQKPRAKKMADTFIKKRKK